MRAVTLGAFVVSLLVQVSYPIAVTLYFRRRTGARWQLFLYGALVFALFQLFTWLPISVYIDVSFGSSFIYGLPAFFWLLALAAGTSLVEETGRWLGYRFLFPRGGFALSWQNGVMFGLGHAFLESALLFAGLTLVYALAYLILGRLDIETVLHAMGSDASLPMQEALQGIMDTSWQQPAVVAIERIMAVPHQVAWARLVMEGHVYRQKRWFAFAVLYHTSIAVIIPSMARLAGFGAAEGTNLLFVLLSLWIILRLRGLSDEPD